MNYELFTLHTEIPHAKLPEANGGSEGVIAWRFYKNMFINIKSFHNLRQLVLVNPSLNYLYL
jgi:hypothetical protein